MISVIIPIIRTDTITPKAVEKHKGAQQIEIITEHDKDRIGCPKIVKKLVAKSKGDYIAFLGDDTIPAPGFLDCAIEEIKVFPNMIGMIGFNDQSMRFKDGSELTNHWVAHRSLLDYLDGEFFHTGYIHCFCDNELQMRLSAIGRYKYSQTAIVYHEHPLIVGGESDPDYDRVYSKEVYEHDKQLFEKRKANNWKN
jgi:hypothetical protein